MEIRSIPYPPYWVKLSVGTGNMLQVAGNVVGAMLLALGGAVRGKKTLATVLMVCGFISIYLCSHAIAHWAAGRLVGLQFRHVGVRGTDHPESYPPGLRQLMSVVPMFTTVSTRVSRTTVRPQALAIYFAAGETSTTVCSTIAALSAVQLGIPGARALLIVSLVGNVLATINTTLNPRGDYAKALAAWRSPSSMSSAAIQA